MSTILKALRKIEDETGRNDGIPAWPGPVQIKRQADARLRHKLKRKQMILAIIILILVSTSAWIYSLQPVSIPNPVDEVHPPVTMVKTPVKGPIRTDFHQTENVRVSGGDITQEDAEPEIPVTERYANNFTRATKPDLSHARLPSMEAVADNQEQPKVPSAEPAIVQKTAHRLDEKRDPRIDLQAIAWAPEPENSFTVINNRILHEGQSFDGITITHIGKDDVFFRESGNEWRETFRIK